LWIQHQQKMRRLGNHTQQFLQPLHLPSRSFLSHAISGGWHSHLFLLTGAHTSAPVSLIILLSLDWIGCNDLQLWGFSSPDLRIPSAGVCVTLNVNSSDIWDWKPVRHVWYWKQNEASLKREGYRMIVHE
jgi:hypothetical protein